MLPSAEALVRGVEFFARRHGLRPVLHAPSIADALAHAARLAGDELRAEPAALFFACAIRSRAFGTAAHFVIPILARAQARGLGLDLTAKDIELDILRARVLRRAIDFEELGAFFAARLQVLPHPR